MKVAPSRIDARQRMAEDIKTVGILETFEACFDRCVEGKTREEAALFAHKVFLNAMEGWLKSGSR
jgi:hypothetical protein